MDLAASEHLSAQIVAGLQEGVIVVDGEGRVTRTNAAAARLFGMVLGELTGSFAADLPDRVAIDRALAGERVSGEVVRVLRRDGTEAWAEVDARPLSEPSGAPYGALATYVDVTERVHRERRIRHEADSDPLTGLANRRALNRALAAALDRARADGHEVGVLMVDLDGFKPLNDAWGHMAGDAALREVASRLVACVRERDIVARVGGDEFVLVLPDLHPGQEVAEACAARVHAGLTAPITLGRARPRLGAAIGVAVFPRDGATGVALLAHADRAMYRAKR